MKKYFLFTIILYFATTACSQNTGKESKNSSSTLPSLNPLSKIEQSVIIHKGTEKPFSGIYEKNKESGTYTCKQCDAALFQSKDKFDANCGWPSFDDAIKGAVTEIADADGRRTEIVCSSCNGHLGHVFTREGYTSKQTRHCVNSISLQFVSDDEPSKLDTVYLGGGCFWGVEYYLQKQDGVESTEVGYTGGHIVNPTYEEVCNKKTGHVEVVQVVYDPHIISFRKLAKQFFELHDFTQVNRQGPDIGEQYRSEIFFTNQSQRSESKLLIQILEDKGYKVATKVTQYDRFYTADKYHQDYYQHKGSLPYCHSPKPIF